MALQAVHLALAALAALAGCGSSWVSQVFLIEKKNPPETEVRGGFGEGHAEQRGPAWLLKQRPKTDFSAGAFVTR